VLATTHSNVLATTLKCVSNYTQMCQQPHSSVLATTFKRVSNHTQAC